VRQDPAIQAMAKDFVFLRIVQMNGVDLNLFRFNYDLTWMAFFMDADAGIYSRYGGRDETSAEGRLSRDGLLWTMKEVLRLHKETPADKPTLPKSATPSRPEDLPRLTTRKECIHCHQVGEAIFDVQNRKKTFQKGNVYSFPLPENIGVKLDLVEGNLIKDVLTGSPAAKAGVKAGNRLKSANETRLLSAADLQHALNEIADNKLTMTVERDGKPVKLAFDLPDGWRRHDVSWRRSVNFLFNIFGQTNVGFFGEALAEKDKTKLSIPADGLAYRIRFIMNGSPAGKAGLKPDDVIVEIDGKRTLPYYSQLRAYFPLEHHKGDEVGVTFVRNGKEMKATIQY
jgi:predicted metalloprotease with PDZ domain